MRRNNASNTSEETAAGRSAENRQDQAPGAAESSVAVADRDTAHATAAAAVTDTGADHIARVAETGYGRTGMMRIARSRGLLAGLLLMVLGIWGAIVPFVGPYFGYGLGSAGAWYFTLGRLWLDVLPGAAVLLGGAVLAVSHNRAIASSGAWLAVAGGAWFVIGSQVSRLWTATGATAAGTVTGTAGHQVAQYMGYFYGLGALICVVAAVAVGRLAVRSIFDVRADLAHRAS